MRVLRLIFVPFALQLVGAAAHAHDFWLLPSSFAPAPQARIDVALRVGMHFQGDPVPRNDAKIRKFVLLDDRGETPLAGAAGSEPAGSVEVGAAGVAVAGYVGAPSTIVLEADQFEQYLTEEGLEHVIVARRQAGQAQAPGKEIYSRCAKAILRVGGAGGRGIDRALGCDFELIPVSLPDSPRGGTATFRALVRGKPAKGLKVVAKQAGADAPTIETRTGSSGRAKLRLPGPGVWLVTAVDMSPAPPASGADWESIWASVTFEAGAAAAGAAE